MNRESIHKRVRGIVALDGKSSQDVVVLFQVITTLLMISTVLIWQIRGAGRISVIVLFLAIVSSICACVFCFLKPVKSTSAKNAGILLLVSALFFIILFSNRNEVCVFLQGKSYGMLLIYEVYGGLALMMLSFALQLVVYFTHRIQNGCNVFTDIYNKQIVYFGTYALIVGFIVCVGAHFVGHWFRWDSASYYLTVNELSIINLFESGRDGLIAGGHPESAYALLVFAIQSICGASTLDAMYISNIVATVLAFVLVVKLFKVAVPSEHSLIYLCAGALFICNPYVLGSMDKLNPDLVCLSSMLLFLVGVSRRNSVLCLIGCFGVCNTRENAAAVLAVIVLAQFVIEVVANLKENKVCGAHGKADSKPSRVCRSLFEIDYVYYVTLLIIGVLWLLVYMNIDWVDHMQQSASHEYYYADGTRFFSVAISPLFIANQIKTILLSNFTWAYVLIIVICAFVNHLGSRKKDRPRFGMQQKMLWLLVVGCVCAIGIQCLLITYHVFRYYVLPVSFVLLICIYYVLQVVLRHGARLPQFMVCAALIAALPLAQCFRTIDPVMLLAFPSFSTGNARLVSVPWHISGYPNNDRLLQSARYNFQIPFLDDALDLAYSKMNLQDAKILFYDGYTWGDRSNSFNTIYGYGYNSKGLYTSWNVVTKKRELNGTKESNLDPVAVSSVSEIEQYANKHDHVYYIELPWDDELAQEFSSVSSMSVEHVDTIEYGGWVLKLYEFSPHYDNAVSESD